MSEGLDPLRFPLWGSRLIEASAGTGKTWTIAALYLRLILGHGAPGSAFAGPLVPAQILVVTFTRAATRELSDRIRAGLVEAAQLFRGEASNSGETPFLQDLLHDYPIGPLREAAAWRLAMAADAMDDAAVHTIDAWCQRMLREHALASGSLFDEELQPDERRLLDEAARDYWRQQVYSLSGVELDAVLQLWPSVEHLIADVRALQRHEIAPADLSKGLADLVRLAHADREVALSNLKLGWAKRLRDMRAWLEEQLASKACPFNRQSLRSNHVAQWFDALVAWADSPEPVEPVISPAARRRLTPEGLLEVRKTTQPLEIPAPFESFGKLLQNLEALPEPQHSLRRHAAASVAQRVRELKQRAGTYGFADMLERLDVALSSNSGERLRTNIASQYPVALIDEFQDTSPLQYRIFDKLYNTSANDHATGLLLIGDPKQSIYAFRGADIHSYLQARQVTAGRHYLLTTNFRSTLALVAAVNQVFGASEMRDGQGAFKFRARAGSGEANPLPFVAVAARGRSERLLRAGGPATALTVCHDRELRSGEEVLRRFGDACAEDIVKLLNDRGAGFEDSKLGFTAVRAADIAVLVRTGREATAVRRALHRRRVASVYLSERDSVFASLQAADLLRWLRAVAEPLNSRLARAAFATRTLDQPLESIAALSNDDKAFEAFIEQLRQLNGTWRRQGVLTMIRQTLFRFKLAARWLAQPEGERCLTNLLHLAELLQSASARVEGEQGLIRWFAEQARGEGAGADEQLIRLESDADLVRVITIYKAKGLEFPIVYVPFGCSFRGAENSRDGVLSVSGDEGSRQTTFHLTVAAREAADHERHQEDLRLLYVALTRACHAVWLGVAALRVGNSRSCVFHRSALGYLLGGESEFAADQIAGVLVRSLHALESTRIETLAAAVPSTALRPACALGELPSPPSYAGRFERHWGIASFSSLVRDLSRPATQQVVMDVATEQELLAGPQEMRVPQAIAVPRHAFPRGAVAGNFLHDQLEWLAQQRFALCADPELQRGLMRRCERQGWGHRADDVLAWLQEVVSTPLQPMGIALDGLSLLLAEMEFWFPADAISSGRIDALCRTHVLAGRPRPALVERALRGMLMGFADLVFEHQGRYWVLDYKSNALGLADDDYDQEALETAFVQHRYDVQASLYLLALHRLLKHRLGQGYDPRRHLGGAVYLFLRGIKGPRSGCHVLAPPLELLEALDAQMRPAKADPA